MAITELHWLNNYSNRSVSLTRLDDGDPTKTKQCPANNSVFLDWWWVPWCSEGADFPKNHIVMTLSGAPASTVHMWQHWDNDGDWVRRSTVGAWTDSRQPPAYKPAEKFPGDSAAGGDRHIHIATNGEISLIDAWT